MKLTSRTNLSAKLAEDTATRVTLKWAQELTAEADRIREARGINSMEPIKTVTVGEAIKVLTALQAHTSPDALLTMDGKSVDVSDFTVHV